jgi:hypothetical protein
MRKAWLAGVLVVCVHGAFATAETLPEGEPDPQQAARPLPNGNALVRSMVERQRSFERAIDEYTYDVVTTEAKLDKKDRVKESHVKRYQIFFVQGQPVRKLVEEDGRPLSAKEAEKEQKRVLKEAEKARRRSSSEKRKDEIRLSDVLDRFDFTAVAREAVDGRDTVLVTFRAQPGKRKIEHDNVLRALQGRLWIDETERVIVRAELTNARKIKVGGGLVASVSSLDLKVDFTPVDQIWLPRRSEAFASGRVLLVKGFRERTTQEFSDYRRFVVSTQETVVGPRE